MTDKQNTHSAIRSKIGDLLSNTPIYRPLHSLYWKGIVPVQNRLRDIKAFRGLRQSGIVKIKPDVEELDPFYMYLNPSVMDQRRRRLRGVYEKPALEVVAAELDTSAVIWEVGGGHGWFSLVAAANGADAYAVEADETAAAAIRIGADATGADVQVFEEFVGSKKGLDELFAEGELPTVIVLDIEGAELDVLRTATQTLAESRPILIIEVHHEKLANRNQSIDDIKRILERKDYSVKELFRRRETNEHILAVPDDI